MERIVAWGLAVHAARDNAELLIKSNHSPTVSAECARRMKRIDETESALLGLADRPKLPPALVRYIKAKDDFGCPGCAISSAGPRHPECAEKIDEYFMARDYLVQFALTAGSEDWL